MSIQETVAFFLLIAALAVGLGAAAFLYARRPEFWLGFALLAAKKAWPFIRQALKFLFRRKSPEEEARDHDNHRRRVDSTITGRERER